MLLTITATYLPANDIGFLLHKNPDNLHSFSTSFGKIYIFYPEITENCCTVALLLDIDPIGLVRNNNNFALAEYVNDRPYVASSFMSVAINRAFRSLLAGQSKHRPELLNIKMPLEAKISVLPCQGGTPVIKRLFEPLGYKVEATRHILDKKLSEEVKSSYHTVILKNNCSLRDLLGHLYVLVKEFEKKYDFNCRA